MNLISENSDLEFRVLGFGNFAVEVLSGKNLLESVSLSVGPLDVVTRPRLWLKTTSEKGPHLSCVVFTEETTLIFLAADRRVTARTMDIKPCSCQLKQTFREGGACGRSVVCTSAIFRDFFDINISARPFASFRPALRRCSDSLRDMISSQHAKN